MATDEFQRIKLADVTFGKYLGSGGFGGVRLATHKSWGDVAVKEFNNVTLTKEVRKEAEKMLRVIHSPYMVRVLGLMEDHVNLCIVMEYFKYGSLKSFQGEYMDCACWPRKVKIMLDIALGMNYLHTLNPPIIHRDLKLDNIFVGSGFEIKIGDLGLAISITSASVKYFEPGNIVGTCSHIPPEIWEGLVKIPDEFWDIYTFAITMYEFLSGKDPWQAFANASLISIWVLRGLRPNVSAIPPEAPVELIDIMKRCWNAIPTARPRFQEIQKEISRVYQSRYEIDLDDADFAIMQEKRKDVTPASSDDSVCSISPGLDIGHQRSSSNDVSSAYQLLKRVDMKQRPLPPCPPVSVDSEDSLSSISPGLDISHQRSSSNDVSSAYQLLKRVDMKQRPLSPLPSVSVVGAKAGSSDTPPTQEHSSPQVRPHRASTDSHKVHPREHPSSPIHPDKLDFQEWPAAYKRSQWNIVKEFGKMGDMHGDFQRADTVAVNRNNIVAVDGKHDRVYVFNKDGRYAHTIVSPVGNPGGKIVFPCGVATTSNGQLAIVECTSDSSRGKYVKLFNVNGTYQRRFCTLSPDEPPYTKVAVTSISVSPDGTILVGDRHRKVTIHAGSDGTWKQKVNLSIEPVYLASNSLHQIIASNWQVRTVVCVDYAGKVVFTLKNFKVNGKPGMPEGVTCGVDDTLYIAVKEFRKSDGVGCPNTGHIHHYSPSGMFMRCIIKDLYSPRDITWHNRSIYIANTKSVVILGTYSRGWDCSGACPGERIWRLEPPGSVSPWKKK